MLVGQGGTASFTDSEHALLTKLLQWPPAQLFPALDLARLLVMEPATAQLLSSTAGEVSNMADSMHTTIPTVVCIPMMLLADSGMVSPVFMIVHMHSRGLLDCIRFLAGVWLLAVNHSFLKFLKL